MAAAGVTLKVEISDPNPLRGYTLFLRSLNTQACRMAKAALPTLGPHSWSKIRPASTKLGIMGAALEVEASPRCKARRSWLDLQDQLRRETLRRVGEPRGSMPISEYTASKTFRPEAVQTARIAVFARGYGDPLD
jgi:hypothetical protein